MFDDGVASGDPTTSSVVLWTRYTGPSTTLRWTVGPRGGREPLATGSVSPAEGGDGTTTVRVDGLPAGAALWYRFDDGAGGTSPEGATATLPDHSDTFTLGVASCADWSAGPFDGYRWLLDQRPDVVLHLGDYLYRHGGRGSHRRHDPPWECTTLADHRRRYRQYRSDPGLAELHRTTPWISLWDDHEFRSPAWRGRRSRRSRTVADAALTDAAIRANLEWLPRDVATSGSRSLDRHRRVGDLLDLVVLDSRLGRDHPVATASDGPRPAPDPDRGGMLAPEQWRWLDEVLAGPPARWTVVASSVQFSPLHLGSVPWWRQGRPRLRPLVNRDQWDGHPADRRRLLDLLGPRAGSVLLLSGDLHGRFLTAAPGDGWTAPELTVPSVSATSFTRLVQRRVPLPATAIEQLFRWLNPHIVDLDGRHHGAALIAVDGDGITVAVGPDGGTTTRLTGQRWAR